MFSGGVLKDSGVLLPLKSEVIRFAAGFKSLDKNAVSWIKLSNEPLKTSNVIYIYVVEFYNDEIFRYKWSAVTTQKRSNSLCRWVQILG